MTTRRTESPSVIARTRRVALGHRALGSPHLWPVMIVSASVLAGNALYFLHIYNPDPINFLSGLGTVTHSGVFVGSTAVDPNIGFTAQALGHLSAVDWLHGHIPWWDPFEGLGAPLAGEMQSAAFFPPTLLLYFSNGQLYAHALVEIVAGLSTYFLLRRLHLGPVAAIAGGIAFALNGTFSWMSHAPENPVAFLPLLLLGMEYAAEASVAKRPWGWRIIAIALALSLVAGFPETAYVDGLLAAVWLVVRVMQLRSLWRRFIGKVTAGLAVGVLLAAPIVVAFVDYLPDAFVGPHNGTVGGIDLPHAAISQMLLPYVYGTINGFSSYDHTGTLTFIWGNVGGYLTASVLVLALIGLVGRRQRGLRIALAAWSVFSLCRIFGFAPLQHLGNLIPGMTDVAFFRYSLPSLELAVVVLAALGLDDLGHGVVRVRWTLASAVAAIAAVVVAVLVSGHQLGRLAGASNSRAWANGSIAWAGVVIVLIALAAALLRGRARDVTLCSLLALDALAMFVVPQLSAPRTATIDTGPVKYLQAHLGTNRFFTLGPLAPDYGSYFDISSLAVNDLPIPKRWADVVPLLDPNSPLAVFNGILQLHASGPTATQEFLSHLPSFEGAGVKYVIVGAGIVLPPSPSGGQLRRVFADAHTQIFELPAPVPLFSVVGGGCSVRTTGVDAASVICRSPHTLVRRELYMAGWSAEVNGVSRPVAAYSGAFQKVTVPAGTSSVVFNFTPPHADLAWLGFLLGVGAIAGPTLLRPHRRRGRRSAGDRVGGPSSA